jgi:D-hexose-6-phosphate mutarotase
MTFKELQSEMEKELEITQDNIQEKSMALSRIYQKYLRIFSSEQIELNKLEAMRSEMYSKLYSELKKNGVDGVDVGKNRNEIESYMGLNKEYREILYKIANQQTYLKNIELSLENISKTSFSIKNYIDLAKMKLGIT